MTVETATFISQLNPSYPASGDPKSEGDNHLQLIKSVLQGQFTSLGAAAVTATAAQLNHSVGVTSAIQTQLDAKAPIASPTFTGMPAAPTAAAATSSTQIATTEFVQAAMATAGTPSSMVLGIVTGTTQAAVANSHYVLTNVALTTVTLPASPAAGDTVWVTPGNGLTTNVIARNGNNIMGLAEDMTLDSANATAGLRYINPSLGWRLV